MPLDLSIFRTNFAYSVLFPRSFRWDGLSAKLPMPFKRVF